MNNKDILVLTLESTAFSKMKADFNNILRKTICNMQIKESSDATLTIKLNISLTDATAPDFSSPYSNTMRKIIKPRFDHKISSVMQIKNEASGSLKGEYELVFDKYQNDWLMKPIDSGQTSLFDSVDSHIDNTTDDSAETDNISKANEVYLDYEYEDGGKDE